jgi:hypothetical protein
MEPNALAATRSAEPKSRSKAIALDYKISAGCVCRATQADAALEDANMAFTSGRSRTMNVKTPRTVPNGIHMQLRPAITRQNT